jgi:hypothetical protein
MKYLKSLFIISLIVFLSGCMANKGGFSVPQDYGDNAKLLLKWRLITREDPKSEEAAQAHFALGEYFFEDASSNRAFSNFKTASNVSKNPSLILLARVYLMRLEEKINPAKKEKIRERYRSIIFSKVFFLSLSEYEKEEFISLKNNSYEILKFRDKIEINKNRKFFERLVLTKK